MNKLRTKIALGLATLAVAAASLAPVMELPSRRIPVPDPNPVARKVNEYEGQHFARKVNEYEGQHFVKKGSFDITESEDQANIVRRDTPS